MFSSSTSKKLFTNLPPSYMKQSIQAPHAPSETEAEECVVTATTTLLLRPVVFYDL